MSFKDISYLELWQPFCLRCRNICALLVEGVMRNNSVKLFEFRPVVQEEMLFKIFLIRSSGRPPVQWSGTICAILKEGIMGNIYRDTD